MPKKPTLSNLLIAGLLAIGYKEDLPATARTSRYRVFYDSGCAPSDRRLLVGKSSALRITRTGRIADSFEAPPRFRSEVITIGEKFYADGGVLPRKGGQ